MVNNMNLALKAHAMSSAQVTHPHIPANTKHLYNICTMLARRRRRWADVVQMLYKCFVLAGIFYFMQTTPGKHNIFAQC